MGNWLFGASPETGYSLSAEKLGEYVQNSLRPSEDCQKQIQEAVDAICAGLQKAKELPLVTDVAQVRKGGAQGFQEPGNSLVTKRK